VLPAESSSAPSACLSRVVLDVEGSDAQQERIVLELAQATVAVEAQQRRTAPVSWSWSTCCAGAVRQMTQIPPCSSSMASASSAVMP
jgi:hypothetical protein